MDPSKITCRVAASAPGLCLAVTLDRSVIYQGDPWSDHDVVAELSDADGTHALDFILSGKSAEHTKINAAGEIMDDVTVSISDMAFDGIALGHLMVEHSKYTHDMNGTGPTAQHKFFGTMGCNGTVTLSFSTPVYLWLLENM